MRGRICEMFIFTSIIIFIIFLMESNAEVAQDCVVYSLYGGEASPTWVLRSKTAVTVSLLPHEQGDALRDMQIVVTPTHTIQDKITFTREGSMDTVECSCNNMSTSVIRSIKEDQTINHRYYHWKHFLFDFGNGRFTVNGNNVCTNFGNGNGQYNLTISNIGNGGLLMFNCKKGCGIWSDQVLSLYNKPFPSTGAWVRSRDPDQSGFFSVSLRMCPSNDIICSNASVNFQEVNYHWQPMTWKTVRQIQLLSINSLIFPNPQDV
ncbi:unnamed protein product [Meganyctiphanes norvegica]|uniref:Uncharacterized protein n=1 Tax=Meganyctiphanes norvegica TaxID=48144 RepID=A0AAV2QT42_MEGNR